MKKICFLGNSHVGCIKQGVEALREADKLGDYEISIFGSPQSKIKHSTIEKGVLRPNSEFVEKNFKWTSGGRSEIRLSNYDQIFLFMGLPPTCIDGYFARDQVAEIYDLPAMSDQFLSRVFMYFESSWPIGIARAIAADSPNLPVNFVGRPFRADNAPPAKLVLSRLRNGEPGLRERIERVTAAVGAHWPVSGPDNLRFPRPAKALLEENGLYTKAKFSRGSLRLHEKHAEHPKDDFVHMNADYGEAMVSHLLGLGSP